MDKVTWEPLRVHRDARGSVFEPLDGQLLCDQRNLHVVVNHPGVAHAIQNTGTEDQVLVALTDRFHNPQAPDTIHKTLINTDLGETP